MGLIVTELYDALIEAGVTEGKARAAAAAIPLTEHLATREDLVVTGRQLADRTAGLGVDLRQEIADLRSTINEGLAKFRAEVKEDIARLDKRIAVLNLGVFSFGPAILALLVKLAFFP